MKAEFKMPKTVTIKGRTSSVTNSFINGIIPCSTPSNQEVKRALEILDLDKDPLKCAYCGDNATEWDHLRPLVSDKRPTGYISEIKNLVPACGKCNQSKGNKNWKEWMISSAELSPKTRGIIDLENKIERLSNYEIWGNESPKVTKLNFEKIVGKDKWDKHWSNCDKLHQLMNECQEYSNQIKKEIEKRR